MPGFDQTGPRGEGPLTGGGRGRCVPDPGSETPVVYGVGRGGRPWGGGRGRCFGGRGGWGGFWAAPWRPAATSSRPDELRAEIKALSEEVAALRAELTAHKRPEAGASEE